MRAGMVRVRALVDFTDRRLGSAKAWNHFVCPDSDARRLVAEGKVEIPTSKIVPKLPEAIPGKGHAGRPEAAVERPSRQTEPTPEPTAEHGVARPWPFSGAGRASLGKPSKPRGGGANDR